MMQKYMEQSCILIKQMYAAQVFITLWLRNKVSSLNLITFRDIPEKWNFLEKGLEKGSLEKGFPLPVASYFQSCQHLLTALT